MTFPPSPCRNKIASCTGRAEDAGEALRVNRRGSASGKAAPVGGYIDEVVLAKRLGGNWLYRSSSRAEISISSRDISLSVTVIGVHSQHVSSKLVYLLPFTLVSSLCNPIQEAVYSVLEPIAGHYVEIIIPQ